MDDEMKDETEARSTTPEIRVSTEMCIPFEVCDLYDPAGGDLGVSRPFTVNIVNGREDCQGASPNVTWTIGAASGTLAPGGTHPHTMTNDRETLELYYGECKWSEQGHHEGPDPGTTPRVTINLIRKGTM